VRDECVCGCVRVPLVPFRHRLFCFLAAASSEAAQMFFGSALVKSSEKRREAIAAKEKSSQFTSKSVSQFV